LQGIGQIYTTVEDVVRPAQYHRVKMPTSRSGQRVTLADVAKQRPDMFPLTVFATYRGSRVEAVIAPSGDITFARQSFSSPSTAASAARLGAGYSGSSGAATNGWDFWSYRDEDGRVQPLWRLREQLMSR
jgi:Restriction Enzyme Adenine Methylase Associated